MIDNPDATRNSDAALASSGQELDEVKGHWRSTLRASINPAALSFETAAFSRLLRMRS